MTPTAEADDLVQGFVVARHGVKIRVLAGPPPRKIYTLVALTRDGKRVGETHPRALLTDKDIDLIFDLRDAGLSYKAIALKFDDIREGGIGKSTVRDIIKQRIRAGVVDRFKRVK